MWRVSPVSTVPADQGASEEPGRSRLPLPGAPADSRNQSTSPSHSAKALKTPCREGRLVVVNGPGTYL